MTPFGTTKDGQPVHKYTIAAGDLRVTLLDLGAVLHEVRLSDVEHNLTISGGSVSDFEGDMCYHGPLIGPVVNRISGAQAAIGEQTYYFDANQDGKITLHSGRANTGAKLWTVADHSASHVTFALSLPNNEGGFPGNRDVTARFEVIPPATLQMTVSGKTDSETVMNFANHSYWNLDGSERFDGHSLKIAADAYLPTTPDSTPTGEIAVTDGTAVDFRTLQRLQGGSPPLDTNFCLSQDVQPLRDVLWLRGESGVGMTVATTAQGVQIYDDRPAYRGLAIEAQNWPDAPSHRQFPSITLKPGEAYSQTTQWRFDQTPDGT